MSDDFEIEAAPPPTDSELSRVATLAERYRAEEREVIRLTKLLRDALRAMRQTGEIDLPEAMRMIGASSFALLDGTKVAVEDKLSGSKLTDPAGLTWVEDNGGASLIKTQIAIEMDRGDVEEARSLMAELRKHRLSNRFKKLDLEESIHQSTIAAFARELIARGEDPPLETIGVHRRVSAIVGSRPKSIELTGLEAR